MNPVVVIDCHEPSLTRYECDENGNKRRTHSAIGTEPCLFDAGEVERFRTHPEGRFYVGPPAPPPGPLNTPGAPAVAVAA